MRGVPVGANAHHVSALWHARVLAWEGGGTDRGRCSWHCLPWTGHGTTTTVARAVTITTTKTTLTKTYAKPISPSRSPRCSLHCGRHPWHGAAMGGCRCHQVRATKTAWWRSGGGVCVWCAHGACVFVSKRTASSTCLFCG